MMSLPAIISFPRLLFAAAALLIGFTPARAALAEETSALPKDPSEFFEAKIRPVLAHKCYKCHSAQADKVKGGLLLDTREGIRQGGDSGAAVTPGKPGESLILKALRWEDKDMRMPPQKEGGKLPESVAADFEAWIKMGAPDPRDGAVIAKKNTDPEKAKDFWAFQAPKATPPPAVQDTAWPRTEVDQFLLAAQEAQGLHPVADADRRTLIRRVTFDLIGLPPKPEDIDAFLADKDTNAFEKVVDRLLASPQFGERWGRHWLDVARYAESTGKERNYTFPTAWRYRDYVIAALNADKPYDQFIREQIAGDLMPVKDGADWDEHIVATGFLAIGPKGLNEKNPEQFRMDEIDEQIDAATRGVLGLTVACARCHDHKFDPIPQRDYYALAGIFHSTKVLYGTGGLGGVAGKNKNATPLITLSASAEVPESEPAATKSGAEESERLKRIEARNPARAAKLRQQAAGKKQRGTTPVAENQCMGVQEGRPANISVLVRGELSQPGEVVPRGFVSVLDAGAAAPQIPANESGRMELAQWLTSPSNPLTARVEVNRIWLHLFGQGLVRTADNFGASGDLPTNPQLLDTLAVEFMRDGWSVKTMIRSLALSRSYQLSSATLAAGQERDPDNRLGWHFAPRRLDAEEIRDAILAASGQLKLAPPVGSLVATVGEGYIGKGIKPEVFSNANSDTRSIYLPIVRDFPPELLDLFDFAESSLVVASRDVTNVPAQALYLMNNNFVRDQSAAMAKRVVGAPLDYPQRISLAYRLALGRLPTEAERARADRYLLTEGRSLISLKGGKTMDAAMLSWSTFCQALFASAEFRYLE